MKEKRANAQEPDKARSFHLPDLDGERESAIQILRTGADSLHARMALINSAQETLDLQYYAINNDVTANLLIGAILKAADRGVRVRLLIDDISVGKVRKELSALDCIGHVSVRIFNPINRASQSLPARIVAFFLRLPKATKRMHNKALIADGRACITGGRNLGDEYFDAHKEMSFKDVDILSLGAVVGQVSESFEAFWSSEDSLPIGELYRIEPSRRYIDRLRRRLEKKRAKNDAHGYETDMDFARYLKQAKHLPRPVRCEFLSDEPHKAAHGDPAGPGRPMRKILSLVEQAKERLLIVSPYFVPGDDGVEWLTSVRARGLTLGVVTNSLASTDVVAVHTGYRKYREALLRAGIALSELKPIDGRRTKQRPLGRPAPSYASLHAKLYILDSDIGIVGSLNFDPRSSGLNTESAMFIHDGGVAAELDEIYRTITSPKASHVLSLEQDGIVWTTEHKGRPVRRRREPEASMARRLQAFLIGMLPVEGQL